MDQAHVFEMLRALGVNYPADIRAIEQMPFEQGEKALEALKERVRKNFRQLAFELHPDRTGNDAAKTERFKALAQVRERLDKMTLRRAPVVPPPQVVFIHVQQVVFRHPFTTMNVTNTAATSTGGTNYGPGGPFYAARMKPT
jgi:hypothetical protein